MHWLHNGKKLKIGCSDAQRIFSDSAAQCTGALVIGTVGAGEARSEAGVERSSQGGVAMEVFNSRLDIRVLMPSHPFSPSCCFAPWNP